MSRSKPSGRYDELLALYKRLHREGEPFLKLAPESTYPGVSILPHVGRIRNLIQDAQLPQWWDELFRETGARYPAVRYETSLIELAAGARGGQT